MGRYCHGEGCATWVADDVEFCTSCRLEFEQSVAANLRDVQARLAAHGLFAEWLTEHPEYKEDV